MEPLRPLIDDAVIKMNPDSFGREEKLNLVGLLNKLVKYDGSHQYLMYALRLYCAGLFRALESGDMSEIKWIDYLDLNAGLLKAQCFILVCAKSYFSSAELQELYKMVIYKKWHVLLVEPYIREHLPHESTIILDSNLCELRLDISADKC